MLSIALLFVGITLVSNGIMFMQKVDTKSIVFINIATAFVLIFGNLIMLFSATTATDYANIGGGLLFGFTYAFISANLLFNLDGKAFGIYSLMVAIFAIVMGVSCILSASYLYTYLWFMWAILWLSTFVSNNLNVNLGKFTNILCIIEGVFAAFVPSIMMMLGILF